MALAGLRRWIDRLLGRQVEDGVAVYADLVQAIDSAEPDVAGLTDRALAERAAQLRQRARAGQDLDSLLIETYALGREAARRSLGQRPHAEQLLAGIALHRGQVAELATGEGKTLAATLPAMLNSLAGGRVQVLTFNDYLARRDAAWMGPVYRFLGLSVGCVQQDQPPDERRRAYAADVTYATAKEAGFDLLRDGRCQRRIDRVQPPPRYAIVDEADSILVDEARIPLVLAGATADALAGVQRAAELVARLELERDLAFDEHHSQVFLTDQGIARVERLLGLGGLHEPDNHAWLTLLNQALHARHLLQSDVDYIVRDGRAELVDAFTGRVRGDRRWPHGLQAAVHAKEGLAVEPEGEVLSSITLQHFLDLYPKLAGMTATARSATDEFAVFYGLGVIEVPPHRPCIRQDLPDRVFADAEAKEAALVEEVSAQHARGRPVLIGTSSVAESERLAARLAARGAELQVLNARNDAKEAAIIAEAGRPGALTVSTNMAGRGVDIKLGGTDEAERAQVLALGGLLVIGTNRHESRRVDDQLRGRAGRQGDPGASCFYVSVEDPLLRRYGIAELLPEGLRPGLQAGPVEDPAAARVICEVQQIIEAEHLKARRLLYRYSSLLETQRRLVQQRRDELLEGRAPGLLAERAPARWRSLAAELDPSILEGVERELRLFQLDHGWCDHLATVGDIHEGLQLLGLGGQGFLVHQGSRLDEYHRRVDQAFCEMLVRVETETVASFERASITAEGVDLAREGLLAPASTWTFLSDESPFGDWLERIFIGLLRTRSRSRLDQVGDI